MASLLASHKLQLSVDCVEFCPFSPNNDLIACGLYQLKIEQEQRRIGGIEILRIDSSQSSTFSFEISASYRTESAGILALRWLDSEKIICACSDGRLRLLRLNQSRADLSVQETFSLSKNVSELLLTVEIDSVGESFLVGNSVGDVFLGQIDQASKFYSWRGHGQSEVWCVEFHRGYPNLVFSGADDCLLKCWDRRLAFDNPPPIVSLRHDAGVTSIFSTSAERDRIWSGSYDDHLRFWDLRNTKTPVQSLNLDGGVWRLREKQNRFLCACMYNGWSIVRRGSGEDDPSSIMCSNNSDGSSLLYGVDWMPNSDEIFVCSTFYDCTVRLYRLEGT